MEYIEASFVSKIDWPALGQNLDRLRVVTGDVCIDASYRHLQKSRCEYKREESR